MALPFGRYVCWEEAGSLGTSGAVPMALKLELWNEGEAEAGKVGVLGMRCYDGVSAFQDLLEIGGADGFGEVVVHAGG